MGAEVKLAEKILLREPTYEYKNLEFCTPADPEANDSSAFPSTITLAHFCNFVYSATDQIVKFIQHNHRNLFSEWNIIAVCNGKYSYRGLAVANNLRRQIILAHRGTVKTSVGNIFSNYKILFQGETGYQLQEACTFTEEIRNLSEKLGYQLIITGHSMGGVLAQVTAATAKFLKKGNGLEFCLRCEEDFEKIHPHVETFESPGAFNVIKTLLKTNPIHNVLERAATFLDVTNFVMAPNFINTIGVHFGTLICVDKALKSNKPVLINSVGKHSILVFIDLFESNQEVSLRIFNWAQSNGTMALLRKAAGSVWRFDATRTTQFEDFHPRMWPDFSFTQKELGILQLIHFATSVGIEFPDENLPRFYIHGSHFKMIKFPANVSVEQRSIFVPKIRKMATKENCEETLKTHIEEHIAIPLELMRISGLKFRNSVLNDLCLGSLSHVKNVRGKIKEVIRLRDASDFDKKLLAVLIRNTWMYKKPNSLAIVLPDRESYERMFAQSDVRSRFLLIKNLLFVVVVKKEESTDLKKERLKKFNYIFIENFSEDTREMEEVLLNNISIDELSEQSLSEVLQIKVGLQKEKYQIILKDLGKFSNSVGLFQLAERLEQGTFLPRTWETLASAFANDFYIHSPPMSKTGSPFDMSLGLQRNVLRVIAANPGMGKTACLANFRHQMKKLNKDLFVFMITLRLLNRALDDAEKISGKELEIIKAYFTMDFFETALFNFATSHLEGRVIFLFDGFDEVSHNSRKNCQRLVNFFVGHKAVAQVWLSTRRDALRVIESDGILTNFEQYDLGLFTEPQQKLFLEKLLTSKNEHCCPETIEKLMDRLKLTAKEFGDNSLGVPLTLRLLVEMKAHQMDVTLIKFYQLIDKYLEMKFTVYYFDKVGFESRTISNSDITEIRLSYNFNILIFYSLRQIYGTEGICKSRPELEAQIKDQRELTRIKNLGLLDGGNEFFHRTIAEFLVAYSMKIALGFYQYEWQSSNLKEWLSNCLSSIPAGVDPFYAYLVKLLAAKLTSVTWRYLNEMIQVEKTPKNNGKLFIQMIAENSTIRWEIQNCIMEHNLQDLFNYLAGANESFHYTRHRIAYRPYMSSEVPILIEAVAQNRQRFSKYLLENEKFLSDSCEFCLKENRFFVFHDIVRYNNAEAFSKFWQKIKLKEALDSAEFSNICIPTEELDDFLYSVSATNDKNILSRMYNFTPLHVAVLLKHENMVRVLLEAGADVHPETVAVSPLLALISTFFESSAADGLQSLSNWKIVKLLLDYGALRSIRYREEKKLEFIQKLDRNMLGAVFKELIKEENYKEIGWGEYFSHFLIDDETDRANSPERQSLTHCKVLSSTLPAAIRSVHLADCDEKCIMRSTDDAVDGLHIRELARRAVASGRDDCTKLFLRHNSMDLFFVDEQFNLLNIALVKGHTSIFKTILKNHPELVQMRNKYGQQPIHLAAKFLNKEAVEHLLLVEDKSINYLTTYGRSLLHTVVTAASRTEGQEILDLLKFLIVDKQMDVNARDHFGKTPLHFACKFSPKFSVIELLIRNGADVNAACTVGNTALHVLAEEGLDKYLYIYCAALLCRSDARADVLNDRLETPTDVARAGHKTGIVQVIQRCSGRRAIFGSSRSLKSEKSVSKNKRKSSMLNFFRILRPSAADTPGHRISFLDENEISMD
ncbi:uncharacterized protein LOC132192539 [Neocloeon triangulifer]|uniref:uncharacterized protein LOC132192539 n=1 Tax=Neocloeon triangulifer TaxID=2078957 RepID=UPI00286EC452|nr:uncharacterized protein LOC132192539 [Neocloeon triangulifer]